MVVDVEPRGSKIMNKKWVASTALASVLAAVGISSNSAHVRAAVTSNDDNNDNQDQTDQASTGKDSTVASVMDNAGAPIDESTADAIDSSKSSSVMSRSAATALTQATSVVSSTTQQTFLNEAVPMAQKAASKYHLFTSVMLAQSILESGWGQSDLATQAHNLFGMKGDYNGAYINYPTREWSQEQGYYVIYANFRQYPSYYESFADNGDKLRNGVSWNTSYYSGAWTENASSYREATAALQGKYATSPIYAQTLNGIIEQYNLTQYDGNASTDSGSNNNSGDNTSQQVKGTVTKINDVATVTNQKSAMLYLNADPDKSANRALGYQTPWVVTAKVVTDDGQTYYKVSSTEYVKAEDVQLKSQETTPTQPPVSISDTAIVVKGTGAKVYSAADTSSVTNRVLPYQSSWITTKYVLDKNGKKFYFVGTNSYLSEDDVDLKSQQGDEEYKQDQIVSYPDIIHVTATPSAKVYNDKHTALAVSLLNNTDWKIDKRSTHADGSVWYRVASGQWVNANDVQVKGSNYIKTVEGSVKINYIPGYGVNVYNSPASNNRFTGTRLADGTTWQVTSQQIVDGQTWYRVSSGWVNGKYCIFTAN